MRSLKPLCLTAAVALALAGTNALAATTTTGISAAGASTSATTGTTTSGTTTGTTAGQTSTSGTTAVVGGCTGTNGSTCTATTSAQSNPSTTTSGSAVVTQQNPPVGTQVSPSGTTTTATTTSGSPAQPTGTVNADPTLSRPGAFDPGGAFGPEAVPATTTTGVVEGGGLIVPGTGTTGSSQQNVFVQPPAQSGVTVMNTPIFDQAARNGQAREARRRAAGDEPRVIGIAPRTERDLTWQMPDDPIIRY